MVVDAGAPQTLIEELIEQFPVGDNQEQPLILSASQVKHSFTTCPMASAHEGSLVDTSDAVQCVAFCLIRDLLQIPINPLCLYI